jgi:hypothetical protein
VAIESDLVDTLDVLEAVDAFLVTIGIAVVLTP